MIHWEMWVNEHPGARVAYVNEATHALLVAGKKPQNEIPEGCKLRVYAHGYWKGGSHWPRWMFWKKRAPGTWVPFIPDGRALLLLGGHTSVLLLWPEHEPGPDL